MNKMYILILLKSISLDQVQILSHVLYKFVNVINNQPERKKFSIDGINNFHVNTLLQKGQVLL
jgi:hypothetical protein